METQTPFKVLLTHFEWNLKRMEDMQNNTHTEYYRNAALQRYGFTVDSAFKCLQARAHHDNQSCETVEEGFQWAHEMGWFSGNVDWKEMTEAYRNMNPEEMEENADAIFDKLKSFHGSFHCLLDSLSALDPS